MCLVGCEGGAREQRVDDILVSVCGVIGLEEPGGMPDGSHEYDLFAKLTRTSTECLTLGQISGLSLSAAGK